MVVLMLCRETPVLISNTEAKPTWADGTADIYRWESRLVPPSYMYSNVIYTYNKENGRYLKWIEKRR